MHKHSIFKCDAPTQTYDEKVAHILAQLPLLTALKSHYSDLRTLINPEMSHQELTKLLMESDLRSPDLRREIMPILLESHLDLPFIKNILKQIEKGNDEYETKEIIKLFNRNINAWLGDPVKRPIIMDLVRSTPKLFACEADDQANLEHRVLYRPLIERFEEKNDTGAWILAIELMRKAPGFCCLHTGKDPIMPYVHFLKNATSLNSIQFYNKAGELFDFTGFDKLARISFQMSNGMRPNQTAEEIAVSQALSTDQVNDFVQKMALSINYVSFNSISTIEQLSNAYAIFSKMKETRPELDTYVNVKIGISKLIELRDANPALFEWTAPKTTSFENMDFLQHEDQMHLFTNVTDILNFQITNKNGTLNRSLFSKLSRFNKLKCLHFNCSKWDQSISDNTSDITSFDVIIDQLPRSLQSVSICNLFTISWDDFEPFVETLATRRPALRIDMSIPKSILEGRPRMMSLVASGRITTN